MRRRFGLVACAGALGLVSLILTGVAEAAVVGHVRVAINSSVTFPSYSTTAGQERVVILQPWDTTDLDALKAADPNVKVLMYENTSSASTTPSWTGIYDTGVPYSQAAANNWLLSNTSGSTFTFSGYSWLYATDIGLSAYQNTWATNVLQKLRSGPWDGVFMDDVNPTIYYHYCVTCVAKYPSDASYGAAMTSFVENVGPQIQDGGYLAVANIGSWPGYSSVANPWLQYLSGAMDEEFLKWGSTAGSGYQDPATWRTQLQEQQLAESENKIFLGVTHSDNTDEAAAVYGYATELLVGNGHSDFYMGADYSGETWFPEYGYAIGDPTGAYSVDASGVYRRVFSGGLVLVNPTTSSQTVDLGGTYSGSGVTNVSSVTMAPESGLILTGESTSSPSAPAPPPSFTPTPAPTPTSTPAPTRAATLAATATPTPAPVSVVPQLPNVPTVPKAQSKKHRSSRSARATAAAASVGRTRAARHTARARRAALDRRAARDRRAKARHHRRHWHGRGPLARAA
jgi:hypothetical protein